MIAALLIAINLYCLPASDRHDCITSILRQCKTDMNQQACVSDYMQSGK
jgi:hypothetical protein